VTAPWPLTAWRAEVRVDSRDEDARFAGALVNRLLAVLAGALVARLLADFAAPFLAFEDFRPPLVVLRAIHHP
jgi:hypothetical protein